MKKIYLIQYGRFEKFFVSSSAKSEEEAIKQLIESYYWNQEDFKYPILANGFNNDFNKYEASSSYKIKKV